MNKVIPIHRVSYYDKKETFNVRLPEVSQLEATNACNFTCDFCPRDNGRPDVFLDPDLVHKMVERGDFKGSHFVEFQLSGEPTLHSKLPDIIHAMDGQGLMLGLSTNGSSMHGERVLRSLMRLNYLTISIDSVEQYESVRRGGTWDRLVENMDRLMETRAIVDTDLVIDLQVIELPGFERQRDLLLEMCRNLGWDKYVEVRTIPDCFKSVTREHEKLRGNDLCLNPWISVSIQSDGDVVPCCYAFGKEVVYGNVKDASLEEIWATSKQVKKLREAHIHGQWLYPGPTGVPLCDKCYQRSPALMHLDLYTNAVRRLIRSEY